MIAQENACMNKLPEITLIFWIMKISATTMSDYRDRT